MQSDREMLESAAGAFGVPAREEGGYLYAGPGEVSQTGWGIVRAAASLATPGSQT